MKITVSSNDLNEKLDVLIKVYVQIIYTGDNSLEHQLIACKDDPEKLQAWRERLDKIAIAIIADKLNISSEKFLEIKNIAETSFKFDSSSQITFDGVEEVQTIVNIMKLYETI